MSFSTTKVNALTNVGNIQDGDVLVGERVNGTTVLITFNGSAIDHDSLTNFVANEHIDWTAATSNFVTTGTAATGALTVTGNIAVTGTVDGRDVATDGTKLDTIETSADVTDETNVKSALDGATITATTVAGTDKILLQDVDDSNNLKTATAQAVADLAASTPGGSDTQIQYNNAGSFGGISQMTYNGTNVSLTTGFTVDGTADEIQLKVQGHSTQTANIFEIENSAASNLFTVDNSGNVTVAGTVDGRDLAADGTKLDGVEASADVTDETNVKSALDGATITSATVATGDKVLIQDVDNSDNLKTVTAQSIADLGGGDWVLVSSATASSSTSIDFTGLSSTYFAYKIVIQGMKPGTDSVDFLIRTSTDGGSTYDSGASDYKWVNEGTGASVVGIRDSADSSIQVAGTGFAVLTTTSPAVYSADITLYNPSSTEPTQLGWHFIYNGSAVAQLVGGGIVSAAADVDAIRFFMSSGNIATGEFRLYGLSGS